ncbi:MAG: hypothetical protein KGI38_11850 [Thaumarchaeota archaeon]|nr:hypothetical protein [Nitrososphaerota archaeon]
MTKQDILGVVEHTHLRRMHYEPSTMKLVCDKHNESLFGGRLPDKAVTRNAKCYFCAHLEEAVRN